MCLTYKARRKRCLNFRAVKAEVLCPSNHLSMPHKEFDPAFFSLTGIFCKGMDPAKFGRGEGRGIEAGSVRLHHCANAFPM